ncbi:hypothetical protein A8F95_10315 [Bacillus wudalianchiensis]|uniref:Uncharacterized protein n=2 Tax=Pseudobacillus wudalianchiensis TaxID=1743143 RepID=A0A1B9AMR4_9BACI|nr:hypothetical protein A8F95_10315 [Bacillus wudalianchiensis]
MLGVKDYCPKLYTNTSAILEEHKPSFKKLKGQRIIEIWTAWDQFDNEWFNNCPVVVCFKDCQIELCAYKTDEYIVTFDQVNVGDEIDWYGTELRIKWEKNKLASFKEAVNKKVKEIEIIEWIEGEGTFLFGIGFQLEGSYFAVCNGLDENIILTEVKEGTNIKKIII